MPERKATPEAETAPARPVTLVTPEGLARGSAREGQPGVFALAETVLKLAAAGLALVAAMGFPAVYLHFSRFGIPTHFASYDHILRAGILPAALLLFVSTYVYWAWLSYRARKPKTRFLYVLLILFAPLAALPVMVLLAGLLAGLLLFFWALSWPFAWLLSLLTGSMPSNRALLYTAGVISGGGVVASLLVVIPFVRRLLLHQRFVSGLRGRHRLEEEPRLAAGWAEYPPAPDEVSSPPAEDEASSPPASDGGTETPADPLGAGRSEVSTRDRFSLWYVPLLLAEFVGGLYGIKGVLYLWDARLSGLLGHRFILLLGAACVAAYSLFGLIVFAERLTESEDIKRRFWGFVTLTGILITLFLGFVTLYSYSFYQRIPRGLGGGRPDRIVIWAARADFPPDFQTKLRRAACGGDAENVKCENLYLIYDDKDMLIVADHDGPGAAGLLLPRAKIKAVSW